MVTVDEAYTAMIAAVDSLIAVAHITDAELASEFVIVHRVYSDPSTVHGRGYVRACTARALGIVRLSTADPLVRAADEAILRYEEARQTIALAELGLQTDISTAQFPDGGRGVTAETITTIDHQRRQALWELVDRPPEIVRRPGVMSGDWVVWGTNVRAEAIEAEIAAGRTEEQILDAYPTLPTGVVAAVRQWRLNMGLITDLDDGVVEVLDYTLIDFSTGDPPAIVYFARDYIAKHGDWIVATTGGDVDSVPRERLSRELERLVARWKLKQDLSVEDLGWSEWQRKIEAPESPT